MLLRSETTLALAAAALLLALLSPAEGDPAPAKVIWREPRLPRSRGSLNPHSSRVRRVAQTALYYFNYKQSSPSSIRSLTHVKAASVKSTPGLGRKYLLQFATKDARSGQNLGSCFATVWYRTEKPRPVVDINCPNSEGPDRHMQQDIILFHSIRDGSEPSEDLLQSLATIGISYILWEKSSEDTSYTVTQVKDFKHWLGENNIFLKVDYAAVLRSNFSEDLPCHVRVSWRAGLMLRVKYDCTSEDNPSESADGSGVEDGSANGDIFQYDENNF